MLRKHLQMN